MSQEDELAALVAAAKDGDVRAFESLISAHLSHVRRFARAFAASEPDADDLAQEALVKVYRSLGSFRFQSAFSSWLYSVVRNAFLDFAKSRASRERLSNEPLLPEHERAVEGGTRPDEGLAQEDERRRLWRALREVPLEFRAALVLFEIDEHSYEEIATLERVAVGTVKSRISRGREALRRVLAEQEEAPGPIQMREQGTRAAAASSHGRRSGS